MNKYRHERALQSKRLPLFHGTELASLPPPSLSSLYSGQAVGMLQEEVVPAVLEMYKLLATFRDEMRPVLPMVRETQRELASMRAQAATASVHDAAATAPAQAPTVEPPATPRGLPPSEDVQSSKRAMFGGLFTA